MIDANKNKTHTRELSGNLVQKELNLRVSEEVIEMEPAWVHTVVRQPVCRLHRALSRQAGHNKRRRPPVTRDGVG